MIKSICMVLTLAFLSGCVIYLFLKLNDEACYSNIKQPNGEDKISPRKSQCIKH